MVGIIRFLFVWYWSRCGIISKERAVLSVNVPTYHELTSLYAYRAFSIDPSETGCSYRKC